MLGHAQIVNIREQRELQSKTLFHYALKYGRLIGSLPFVRMVALTGSLALLNVSKTGDFDYMLVTHPGRLWTARAFCLLLGRFTKLFGHTICPNLIVSESSLEWHRHDLYSARELCQMIPITGLDIYRTLMNANDWIRYFLPNANMRSNNTRLEKSSWLQKYLEFPLCGKFGEGFEQWEMNRKIARFSRQEGFGEETIFNEEMCQGNFEHHRRRTEEKFMQRINSLSIETSFPKEERLKV